MIRDVGEPAGRLCPDQIAGNTWPAPWGYLAVAVSEGAVVESAPGMTRAGALAGLVGEVADASDSLRQDRSARHLVTVPAGGEIEEPVTVRLEGTPFQLEVWEALMAVPRGSVVTYSELATSIGRPRAVRAVASACAANRLGVIVPCHRVVRTDGSLGGYRWGEGLKRQIIAVEVQAEGDAVSLLAA